MAETKPLLTAKHAIITDECRINRTDAGAIDEALRRIRDEYNACIPNWPIGMETKFHLKLEIERG